MVTDAVRNSGAVSGNVGAYFLVFILDAICLFFIIRFIVKEKRDDDD
ncbi:hypothetical protein UY416_25565 [Paenibacillus polymyxa]|nr:hypothetical protein [Paenibacillus polymyxa]MDY8049662.1 hypothetical protein [Paenibacillus polymyxa]